jgi:hypothetical protein
VSLGNALSSSASSSSSSTAPVSRDILGRVTNALDGSPVPRVQVTLNSRTVLTDSQGRFEFQDFTDTQASVMLIKPGFSQTNDMSTGNTRQRVANLDAPVELKIYPDATITGTVTGRDGLPLTHVPVLLRREVFDQNGRHWQTTHTVQTDLRGEYRFRDRGGRFQLGVGYVQRSQDTGEAVLPVSFPSTTSSESADYFEVASGQEKHIDLRPKTGMAYPVQVRLDGEDLPRGIQIYAVTAGGEAFQASLMGQGGPGGFQVSLPVGTYTLHARVDTRETSMEGSARATVVGKQNDPVTIHLEPAAVLTVELAVDPASTTSSSTGNSLSTAGVSQASQPPDLRQFNLRLHNLSASTQLPGTQDIPLRQGEDKRYEFRVPPGRYKLQAFSGGQWYVESATAGVTNLMTSELVIASGGSGTPIQIVANNLQGMVNVTVRLTPNADNLVLYFIPRGPSLAQVNPFTLFNTGSATASFSTSLPAGSYLAVVLDHPVQDDLRNPDVVSRFSTDARTIEVSPAATATVELDIAQEKTP